MSHHGVLHSHQTFIALVQRFLDVFFIATGMFLALFRFDLTWQLQHSTAVFLAMFMFHFVTSLDSFYISWRGLSIFKELKKTIGHWCIVAGSLFLALHYYGPQYLLPEAFQITWFILTAILLCSYRIAMRLMLRFFRSRGYNTRNIVVVGAGALGQRLAQTAVSTPSLGLVFSGYYDDFSREDDELINAQIIGDLNQLLVDVKNGGIDRVYIALPMRAEKRIKWLMNELADTTASVYLIPDVYMFELLHSRNDSINGIPTISIYDSPMDGSNAVIKRVEDVVLSFLILIMISPLLLVIACVIKCTSKGPVIFKQKRYGVDGKSICVWKFRSMTVMENSGVVTQASKNDVRVTKVGRFLRKTSLDELPQFFNALQGRMSIVGPRPHAIAHNEEYRKLIIGYMLRHKVKPGITGWAQVNGWRGETDTLNKMEKRIEFDLEYIRNWSLVFDLKIILATVFKGFINKNAY